MSVVAVPELDSKKEGRMGRKKKIELTKEEKQTELEQALDIEKKCIEVFIDQIRISRKRAAKIMEELEGLEDG